MQDILSLYCWPDRGGARMAEREGGCRIKTERAKDGWEERAKEGAVASKEGEERRGAKDGGSALTKVGGGARAKDGGGAGAKD